MRTIQNLEELNIPSKYRDYISKYIENIADLPFINRVILFGSCARGGVSSHSDIDIFVTVNREISEAEEFLISSDRLPDYNAATSISTDILVQPETTFNKFINTTCMIQKQVQYYGVDLSGLISKCSGNGTSGNKLD